MKVDPRGGIIDIIPRISKKDILKPVFLAPNAEVMFSIHPYLII